MMVEISRKIPEMFGDYPYITKTNYETGSNTVGWKK